MVTYSFIDIGTTRMLRSAITVLVAGFLVSSCTSPSMNVTGSLPNDIERVWIGSDFYANRLMDWRYANDRIECIEGRSAKPMRTLHLLTHYLGDKAGEFNMFGANRRFKPRGQCPCKYMVWFSNRCRRPGCGLANLKPRSSLAW